MVARRLFRRVNPAPTHAPPGWSSWTSASQNSARPAPASRPPPVPVALLPGGLDGHLPRGVAVPLRAGLWLQPVTLVPPRPGDARGPWAPDRAAGSKGLEFAGLQRTEPLPGRSGRRRAGTCGLGGCAGIASMGATDGSALEAVDATDVRVNRVVEEILEDGGRRNYIGGGLPGHDERQDGSSCAKGRSLIPWRLISVFNCQAKGYIGWPPCCITDEGRPLGPVTGEGSKPP